MDRYLVTVEGLDSGLISRYIKDGLIKGEVIIPWIIINMIEKDIKKGSIKGERLLKELKMLRGLEEEGYIKIRVVDDVDSGENITRYIVEYSKENNATILTSDPDMMGIYHSLGGRVKLLRFASDELPSFIKYFDGETMSIHLKEGVPPRAKKGRPGNWVYRDLEERIMDREDLENIINEIIEYAKEDGDSFIERVGKGVTIVQLRDYRIIISKPPFSDGYEATIVRPIAKLSLEDYNLPPALIKRFKERAEGILVAGAPGEGKSTFCQALAEFYRGLGKVVKTIESPRDLQLPPDITQYSKSYGDESELYDIMLLSRPDYTIFDEMRTTEDFKLFIDLRLAGVGMVGVVHAARPIDAIQRFVERLELGMIPSVLDTVIFLKGGEVDKVYEVSMAAKVPYGLSREDLARPVVEVRDFITKKVEYEFYVFGKRVFVIPVGRPSKYIEAEAGYMTPEEIIRNEIGDIADELEIKMVDDKRAVLLVPTWSYRQISRALKGKARRLRKKYGIKLAIEPVIGFDEE